MKYKSQAPLKSKRSNIYERGSIKQAQGEQKIKELGAKPSEQYEGGESDSDYSGMTPRQQTGTKTNRPLLNMPNSIQSRKPVPRQSTLPVEYDQKQVIGTEAGAQETEQSEDNLFGDAKLLLS